MRTDLGWPLDKWILDGVAQRGSPRGCCFL